MVHVHHHTTLKYSCTFECSQYSRAARVVLVVRKETLSSVLAEVAAAPLFAALSLEPLRARASRLTVHHAAGAPVHAEAVAQIELTATARKPLGTSGKKDTCGQSRNNTFM